MFLKIMGHPGNIILVTFLILLNFYSNCTNAQIKITMVGGMA